MLECVPNLLILGVKNNRIEEDDELEEGYKEQS